MLFHIKGPSLGPLPRCDTPSLRHPLAGTPLLLFDPVLKLFVCLFNSSRQDQECGGERAASHVPEIPAVLLALPTEHGK